MKINILTLYQAELSTHGIWLDLLPRGFDNYKALAIVDGYNTCG